MPQPRVRRRAGGVELQPDASVHARVWAPACRAVELVVASSDAPPRAPSVTLDAEGDGYFTGTIRDVPAGTRYWFRLDGDRLRPDPCSRSQPDGPHGPSAVVDPDAFAWTDAAWRGVKPQGQVIYEMHVGTFTPEGTWAAAAQQLEELVRLGITVVEMMPVHDFAGRFGWGYDSVNLYAPTRLYGRPDDLRAFVDRAHAAGLAVILDVVYNHLGPDGNYLGDFSPDYFTDRYTNDWGPAVNFEGPAAARDFFVENAGYWIEEFHFDGLRLDATQDIQDNSAEHVILSMTRRAREAAPDRAVYIVGENEPQNTRLVAPPSAGGYGLDALWNDDYHHSVKVALTGRIEAYYTDYTGSPQELISCAKHGFLYQGQWYKWQQKRRGSPSFDIPGHVFVWYMENHDQIANAAFGRRLHQLASPGRHRALTALTLLGPATPLLFQGQEFSASAPFLYFADHPDLEETIGEGRREFLSQFASLQDTSVTGVLPSPSSEETFVRCKLDLRERTAHATAYALHRDLLALRRSHFSGYRRLDGAVIGPHALVLRFFGHSEDRLLLVNMGSDLDLCPVPEPLLAPPAGGEWAVTWSSESVDYGGQGTPPLRTDEEWHVPGEAAVVLSCNLHP
jgi:maltooligosyltrehalose trehalohydrolase